MVSTFFIRFVPLLLSLSFCLFLCSVVLVLLLSFHCFWPFALLLLSHLVVVTVLVFPLCVILCSVVLAVLACLVVVVAVVLLVHLLMVSVIL